ncbi:MAG TPA: hypothetical protein VJA23_00030 [Candidatus Nanoarchaeia archaeon]|nr:hypothetical protein [Candidatus Nanoarchaeia archaeon]
MKKIIILLAILVVSLLVMGGCTPDEDESPPQPTIPTTEINGNSDSLEENNLQPPALPEE